MAFVTLKDLRKRVYDRLDEGASQYHTPQKINLYLNEALADMHNMLAIEDPWRLARTYYCKPLTTTITLDPKHGPYQEFTVPRDLARVLECSRPILHLYRDKVRVLMYSRSQPLGLLKTAGAVTPDMLRIEFVPSFTPFENDTTLLRLPFVTGHDRWVVQQAVILAKMKEEVSTLQLQDQQDRLWMQMLTDVRHNKVAGNGYGATEAFADERGGWPCGYDPLVVAPPTVI